MTEPFVGEIRLLSFDFAPFGWAKCHGQELPIVEYQKLYSLLGTTYGGDGKTTFALPDLRGRVAINQGQGPKLSDYRIGHKGGAERTDLTVDQMPQHAHKITSAEGNMKCNSGNANQVAAVGNLLAQNDPREEVIRFSDGAADADMKAGSVAITGDTNTSGGSQDHNNMEPYLVLNYCIALDGIFPSRN
jgi:microcystin-dependent protein